MISFSSWVQHLANSVSQTFLPYLWTNRSYSRILPKRIKNMPVVEVLQSVHDCVRLSMIVMCGQVVNPAAKRLTGIKEGLKPFVRFTPSCRGTYQNLVKWSYEFDSNILWVTTLSGYRVCSSIHAAAASSGARSAWSEWLGSLKPRMTGYFSSTTSVMSSCQGLSVSS